MQRAAPLRIVEIVDCRGGFETSGASLLALISPHPAHLAVSRPSPTQTGRGTKATVFPPPVRGRFFIDLTPAPSPRCGEGIKTGRKGSLKSPLHYIERGFKACPVLKTDLYALSRTACVCSASSGKSSESAANGVHSPLPEIGEGSGVGSGAAAKDQQCRSEYRTTLFRGEVSAELNTYPCQVSPSPRLRGRGGQGVRGEKKLATTNLTRPKCRPVSHRMERGL